MHQCLTILELLDSIAEYLGRTNKKSLTAFAATCRVFYDPGMNAIWKDMNSLKPLVKCFPRNTWSKEDSYLVCWYIHLQFLG